MLNLTVDVRPPIMANRLCSFGITEIAVPLIAGALTTAGVGAATSGIIAGVAGPALVGAGVGALGSAITGSDPGRGALFGGLGGGALGGLGMAFPETMGGIGLGQFTPGGQIPSSVPITGQIFGSPEAMGGIPSEASLGITPQVFGSQPGSYLNPVSEMASSGASGGGQGASALSRLLGGGQGGQGGGISPTGLGLGLLSALGSQPHRPDYGMAPGPGATAKTMGPLFNSTFPAVGPGSTFVNRTATPSADTDWYHYGETGGHMPFFQNNQLSLPGMKRGGALGRHMGYAKGGGHGYVEGPGDGMEDAIPAKLSDGEFVVNADVVSALGNGSNRKGAERLEHMRRAVMRDRGTPRVVPKQVKKSPLQYLHEASNKKRRR